MDPQAYSMRKSWNSALNGVRFLAVRATWALPRTASRTFLPRSKRSLSLTVLLPISCAIRFVSRMRCNSISAFTRVFGALWLLRSSAPLVRDRSILGVWTGPGSEAHYQEMLRCARDKRETSLTHLTLPLQQRAQRTDDRLRQ